MAEDVRANIGLNVDTSQALAGLKALQSEISALHVALAKMGPSTRAGAAGAQRALIDNINATGKFAASMTTVKTTAESFTTALEKNKLTMGEYFRYAGGASKSFGKNFAREFATIEKVAIERVKTLQTQYIKLGRDANGAMKAIAVRPLTLDMNSLQTKTAIAAQKQQLLNQLLKQGSTQMLNWGKNTQWAGRQLMVGFSIPLALFASKAMRAFSDMEKQIISFKRVYGDLSTSASETDAMAESIKNLSLEFTKYGLAVSDTIDMAAKAAAMGKTGADLLGQVQQASKLAVLGQVEQQQALQTTISLTNTFGTSTQDLGKKINFLNAVENQTSLSIEDLTIAIPKAGPVVKQLGGDVEDLAFFLTAMKEGGINASEGANALKSGLASIINPTAKASQMLQGFGINLNAIVKRNKGDVRGTVTEFAKALDKLDPLNRAKAIEQLFGKFQFARISTLMKNVASDSSQAATTAQLAQKSSIELAVMSARELRKISSSPLYKFQKSIQDFQTAMAPIGEAFMKFVTPIIDWVNGLLNSFNKLGDGTKTFIVGFTSVVAGLGPILLMTFGLIANGFANLIKGFAAIKSMFNRVQTSSEILGQETNYLTEEQMKAKAVAASLDQVHGKLVQTFNVEAESVNMLAAAYERAVVASQSLMPGVAKGGAKTKATRKFSTGGIFKGPGTGTSDSILARVSNNEAIIPAKSVEKYPGIVNALIDGNIPGFSKGKNGKKESRQRNTKTTIGNINLFKSQSRSMPPSWSRYLKKNPLPGWQGMDMEQRAAIQAAEAEMRSQGFSEAKIARNLRNLTGVQLSHLNPQYETVSLGKGAQPIKRKLWNVGGVAPDLAPYNQYLKSITERQKGEYLKGLDIKKLASSAGISVAQAKKEMTMIQQGQHPQTSAGYKLLAAIGSQDTDPRSSYQGKAVAAAVKASNGRSGYLKALGSGKLALPEHLDASAKKDAATSLARAQANHAKLTGQTQAKTDKKVAKAQKAAAKAEETTANTKIKAAKESVKSAAKEKREAIKAAVAKRKLGETLTRKEKQLVKIYDEEIKARTEKAAATRKANAAAMPKSQAYAVSGVDQYMVDEKVKTPGKISKITSGAKKRLSPILSRRASARAARKAAAAKFAGGKLMGAGMGISIAGSMAGAAIGGDTGAMIGNISSILGSVAMLASAFPALASGIAAFLPEILIAAAVIGGLVLVVNELGKAEKERLKQIKLVSSATKMTKDKKQVLGDFFGKQTTDSYLGSITATNEAGLTNPQEAAVSELRKNADFKSKYASTIEAMKNASNDQLQIILQNLSLGLSKDFSKEEIAVIVKALQDEAGKTDVKLEFSAIDVTTKTGRQDAQTLIRKSQRDLKKEGKKSYNPGLYDLTPKTLSDAGFALPDSATVSDVYKNLVSAIQSTGDQLSAAKLSNDTEEVSRLTDQIKMLKAELTVFKNDNQGFVDALGISTNSISNYYDALRSAYDRGEITKSTFVKSIKALTDQILAAPDRISIVDGLVNQMGSPSARAAVRNIKDARAQIAGILALGSGQNTDKIMAILEKIRIFEMNPLNAVLNPNAISDWIAEINKLASATTPITTTDTDPYGTGKDTLTKKQQARQKKWQDAMSLIGIEEDKINKKYEDRIAALDKVNELNQAIAASQKDQLDLADALSRGDIAAAARAAQTMRSNDAQRSYEQQKKALEQAQQDEINALTVLVNGKYYTKDQVQGKLDYYNLKSIQNSLKNNTVGVATGGHISGPGTGTSDSIPAMLSNGEYVIRAKAAEALGIDTLDKLNHAEKFALGGFARKFARGGEADGSSPKSNKHWWNKYVKPVYDKTNGLNPFDLGARQDAEALWHVAMGQSLIMQGLPGKRHYYWMDKNGFARDQVTNKKIIDLSGNPMTASKKYISDRKISPFANGGVVSRLKPSYFADGDLARGTDTVPAMLTPGEFIMSRSAVQDFGVDNLRAINSGAITSSTSDANSVYNYSINVNVATNSDADEIARSVMTRIKRINSQRVRGV